MRDRRCLASAPVVVCSRPRRGCRPSGSLHGTRARSPHAALGQQFARLVPLPRQVMFTPVASTARNKSIVSKSSSSTSRRRIGRSFTARAYHTTSAHRAASSSVDFATASDSHRIPRWTLRRVSMSRHSDRQWHPPFVPTPRGRPRTSSTQPLSVHRYGFCSLPASSTRGARQGPPYPAGRRTGHVPVCLPPTLLGPPRPRPSGASDTGRRTANPRATGQLERPARSRRCPPSPLRLDRPVDPERVCVVAGRCAAVPTRQPRTRRAEPAPFKP